MKPAPATPPIATDARESPMERVVVLFTGGTISMGFDPVAGGNIPSLDGAAILARTPGLGEIAEVVPWDRGLLPASHFTFDELFEIGSEIERALADPTVSGVVVVQGTDTIEETGFVWDLLHGGDKPVVVTGAMRAPHEPGFDGADNLRDAVSVAASDPPFPTGVVVVMARTIEPADDVQKTHTTDFSTFRSPNVGSLGHVVEGRATWVRARGPRRRLPLGRAAPRVHIVTAGIETDGDLLSAAVAARADGIVVAATGSGNTAVGLLAAARRAMSGGVPVVLASRCPSGSVGTGYAFPGGGADWVRAGAIPAGHLCAIKARVALAMGIGAGLDHDRLATLMADPLP